MSLAYNAKDQSRLINAKSSTYAGANQWEVPQYRDTVSLRHSALGVSSSRELATNQTDRYTRDPSGELIGLRSSSGASYYFLFDGLGSVVALTGPGGTVAATYRYEPYGRIFASTGTVVNPWRYAGGYHDPDTGLTKFGLRYYHPAQMRWTQRDPVEQPLQEAGWNDYIYAGNDPVSHIDPAGDIRLRVRGYWARKYCGTFHPGRRAKTVARAAIRTAPIAMAYAIATRAAESPEARRRGALCLTWGFVYQQRLGPAAPRAFRAGAFLAGCVTGAVRGR